MGFWREVGKQILVNKAVDVLTGTGRRHSSPHQNNTKGLLGCLVIVAGFFVLQVAAANAEASAVLLSVIVLTAFVVALLYFTALGATKFWGYLNDKYEDRKWAKERRQILEETEERARLSALKESQECIQRQVEAEKWARMSDLKEPYECLCRDLTSCRQLAILNEVDSLVESLRKLRIMAARHEEHRKHLERELGDLTCQAERLGKQNDPETISYLDKIREKILQNSQAERIFLDSKREVGEKLFCMKLKVVSGDLLENSEQFVELKRTSERLRRDLETSDTFL